MRTQPFAVATELEAFINGRYVEWCLEREKAVPTWAWLNRFAHGSEAQIAIWLIACAPTPATPGWPSAMTEIARAVIRAAAAAGGLRPVQRDTLIPLELALVGSDHQPELTPGQLVALVRRALAPAA